MQQIPPPLRAVNDRLSLTGSYNWGRDTIFYFLQDVLNRSAFYGVDPLKLPDLRKIWLELKGLSCPSGGDYVAGSDLEPDQHILRARNRSWQGQPNTSKFNLRSHPHNSRPYSNPYDLLGLFLSSLGPAPFAATKANFYLPLTAVYGWWCSQIAGKPIGGVGAIPYVFQCTWRKRDGEQAQFFLGSSVAGYEGRLAGSWPRIVKSGRFQLLQDTLSVDGKYGFDLSPSLINNAATGTRFGNCAETHPFLELM
ncbi:hypothetical protein MMC31_002897, partial [Peltigera leucophlebia]|nr:hypothetical protein [Peltigera leucophlebia]